MKVLFLPDYSEANAYQRSLSASLEALGVQVRADPTRSRRMLPVSEALLRTGRPDIIHVHWTEPYIARRGSVSRVKARRTLLELRLAKRAGVGVVWTAHDLFRHDKSEDPAELAFMRSLFRLADKVIVHCEAAAEGLLAALHLPPAERGRVAVIRHGHYRGAYPDTMTRAQARAELGLGVDARVIAFVGWVRSYKGVIELIEAFAGLDEPDARLLIAGRAVDSDYSERVTAGADRDERVRLDLGFVPDARLQVYLRAADVVATPFLEIFTSGSVLLAMSFERAVIAPRRGCVVDTLDDGGSVLYDVDDPQGLEGALRVAMDADLEAMGRHNGARIELFDWSRVAEATRDAYREVLEA